MITRQITGTARAPQVVMSLTRRLAVGFAALALVACAATDDGADDPSPDGLEQDEVGAESTASALSSGVVIETHFTNPKKTEVDMTILDDLIRMIDDTPKDESIDLGIHSITVNAVAKAIIEAKNRGVKVRVAHNGEDFRSADGTPKALAAGLGAAHRFCGNVESKGGDVGGCISAQPSSIMHSKLVLFSKTKDATGKLQSSVSWFGSANLTFATGARTFNNTVTVYGDQELYARFERDYFAKLWSQTHVAGGDFYNAGKQRGLFSSAASHVSVYASPNQNGDFVLDRLALVEADAACRIRVSQAMIHGARKAIVDKLVSLKHGGCSVWVAGNDIDSAMLAELKHAGISVHENKIHDKMILVNAKYACGADCKSAPHRKIVFTGSHNWTQSANETNDELFVKVDNARVYDAFQTHFNANYNSGKAL
jgi:phosphatidylserine/phosphatidylglycerophosphate/cardiolipin synthase-like enzyme